MPLRFSHQVDIYGALPTSPRRMCMCIRYRQSLSLDSAILSYQGSALSVAHTHTHTAWARGEGRRRYPL